jgi:hypothetical protein
VVLAPGSSKASLGSAASRKDQDLEDKVVASLIWDLEVTIRGVGLAAEDEEEDGRTKDHVFYYRVVMFDLLGQSTRNNGSDLVAFSCIQSVLTIPLRVIFKTMSLSYSQLEIRGKGAVAGD